MHTYIVDIAIHIHTVLHLRYMFTREVKDHVCKREREICARDLIQRSRAKKSPLRVPCTVQYLHGSFNKLIFFSSGNFETSAQIVGSTFVLISSVSLRK